MDTNCVFIHIETWENLSHHVRLACFNTCTIQLASYVRVHDFITGGRIYSRHVINFQPLLIRIIRDVGLQHTWNHY